MGKRARTFWGDSITEKKKEKATSINWNASKKETSSRPSGIPGKKGDTTEKKGHQQSGEKKNQYLATLENKGLPRGGLSVGTKKRKVVLNRHYERGT